MWSAGTPAPAFSPQLRHNRKSGSLGCRSPNEGCYCAAEPRMRMP